MAARTFVIWVLACFVGACGLLDEVQVSLDDQVTIPATTIGSPFVPSFPGLVGLDFGSQQELVNNDIEPGDIDAIYVLSARLDGTEPGKDNLAAIIDRVELFVESPGLERVRIAELTEFPSGPSAELNVDKTLNLEPYGTAPSMTVDVEMTIKEPRAFPTTVKITVDLLVDVNLGGV